MMRRTVESSAWNNGAMEDLRACQSRVLSECGKGPRRGESTGARQASFGGLGWRGGLGMVGGCALACWDEGRVLECAGELAGRVLER
jgi:hypothetical protein